MKGTIVIIRPDGSTTRIEVPGRPTLDALKSAIGGGYIELVPGFTRCKFDDGVHDCVAFCDEEGKLKDLPFNRAATVMWGANLPNGLMTMTGLADHLCGDIAVVYGDKEFMEAL